NGHHAAAATSDGWGHLVASGGDRRIHAFEPGKRRSRSSAAGVANRIGYRVGQPLDARLLLNRRINVLVEASLAVIRERRFELPLLGQQLGCRTRYSFLRAPELAERQRRAD